MTTTAPAANNTVAGAGGRPDRERRRADEGDTAAALPAALARPERDAPGRSPGVEESAVLRCPGAVGAGGTGGRLASRVWRSRGGAAAAAGGEALIRAFVIGAGALRCRFAAAAAVAGAGVIGSGARPA